MASSVDAALTLQSFSSLRLLDSFSFVTERAALTVAVDDRGFVRNDCDWNCFQCFFV
jgi:hypothetical protein